MRDEYGTTFGHTDGPVPPSGTAPPPPPGRGDLGRGRGVHPPARGLPGRVPHRRQRDGPGAVRELLPPPDGRHHRRLPPLLLPPLVQDQPPVPVRAGLPGLRRRAEGAALVGGPAPAPPPHLRHARRPALARRPRPLAVARRLGVVPGFRRDGRPGREGPQPLPRAPLVGPPPL